MGWLDRISDFLVDLANDDAPPAARSHLGGDTPPKPVLRPVRRDDPAEGLFKHYSDYDWPYERWPNFAPRELACPHCGELYVHINSIDLIQKARKIYGGPLLINSAHRCIIHNTHVGGAPMSQHKKIAFDVSIRGRDRFQVLGALQQAGFTTFGFYQTFIHTDIRPGRRWYSGPKARALWER